MTTLTDRPNTALVVIDVQNGVVTGAHQRNEVVGRIAGLVDRARAESVPVVWDSFEDTELEVVLAARGVGRLVVTGAQTDACVRSTLHGAFARGYDATLVSDAHTTEDLSQWGAPTPDLVIAHTNLYWSWQSAPGRTAGTVEAAEAITTHPEVDMISFTGSTAVGCRLTGRASRAQTREHGVVEGPRELGVARVVGVEPVRCKSTAPRVGSVGAQVHHLDGPCRCCPFDVSVGVPGSSARLGEGRHDGSAGEP